MLNNTTRLYVSPLTPSLLPAVLGPSLTEVAQNISYHEIQTLPENNYGYIELPAVDAERLRKKLSGAILRGSKMKVEEARPKKRRRADQEDDGAQHISPAKSKKASTTKRKASDTEAISGHQLCPERKVQRGWTEPAKEKKSKKAAEKTGKKSSKYTDKEELLFRTKVPANKADLPAKKPKKVIKARHGAEEHTVHEFEKTVTQPTFLKTQSSSSRANLEYVDGKGWVDESGEVVEAEPASARRKKHDRASKPPKGQASGKHKASISKTGAAEAKAGAESDTSSSALSTSSSEDHSEEESTLSSAGVATPRAEQGSKADPTSGPEEVHPLESLFKKPQKPASQDVAKPSLEITTGFSFFGDDADDIEEELEVPSTPFSQDTRARGLRSAAPTPDTAHPSRFSSYDSARFLGEEVTEEEEEDVEQEDKEVEIRGQSPKQLRSTSNLPATSDFEKLFWEKRGDNNRAWKGRRRAVLKEKRHRENRARRPKNW